MPMANISGIWRSEAGRHYRITQVNERFMWQVDHGVVVETGLGAFVVAPSQESPGSWKVEATWNCHGGDAGAAPRRCTGCVRLEHGQPPRIEWADLDDFTRVEPAHEPAASTQSAP